jgi:hypothetical protein
MAEDEGDAGAVNLYGRAYGLPRAGSGMMFRVQADNSVTGRESARRSFKC